MAKAIDKSKVIEFDLSENNRLTMYRDITKKSYFNKKDYTCTVFSAHTIRKKIRYETNYAYLYSIVGKTNIHHEFVVCGPNFQSLDGEYHSRVVPYEQILSFYKEISYVCDMFEQELLVQINKKKLGLHYRTFFASHVAKNMQDKFDELIQQHKLTTLLLIASWIAEANRTKVHIDNNLWEGYIQTILNLPIDINNFVDEPKGTQKFVVTLVSAIIDNNRFIFLGQKMMPLTKGNIRDDYILSSNIWQEVLIELLVTKLVLEGICPSFPLLIDWFILPTSDKSLFDNLVIKKKIDVSVIAKEMVNEMMNTQKKTFLPNISERIFINEKMGKLSHKIDETVGFANNRIIYDNKTLVTVKEHVGRTMFDIIGSLKSEVLARIIGRFDQELDQIQLYIFEYLYGLLCLNKYIGIIHGDLHMNNIVLSISQINKPTDDKYIIFDLGKKKYAFLYFTSRSTIIDFSRSILSHEFLIRHFPTYEQHMIKMQRKKLLELFAHEFPELAKDQLNSFESLAIRNYKLAFKIMTLADSYKLMKNMYTSLSIFAEPSGEVLDFLDKTKNIILRIFNNLLAKAFHNLSMSVDEFDYPNAQVIGTVFYNHEISQLPDKEQLLISDQKKIANCFDYTKQLDYAIDERYSLPVFIRKNYPN